MTVLDTFYTVFKSTGGDSVLREQDAIDNSLKRMKSDFDAVDETTNKVTESFGKLGGQLLNGASKVLLLIGAFSKLKDATQYAINIDFASQRLGVNTEELGAWGNAIKHTGGNLETFEHSLEELKNRLGVTGETALKVLPQLADSFQKLGQVASFRYGRNVLGLDEATILLLQKGSREVNEIVTRQKELGVVTKEDTEITRKFNDIWINTTQTLEIAFLEVAAQVLPILTKLFTFVGEGAQYLRKHVDFVIGTLGTLGVAAALVAKRFTIITTAITLLASAFGALYEDIKAFVNGTDSLIGRLLYKFPLLRKELEAIIRLARDLNSLRKVLTKFGDDENATERSILKKYGVHSVYDEPKTEASTAAKVSTAAVHPNNLALSDEDIEKLKNSKEFLRLAGTSVINNHPSNIVRTKNQKTYNFSIGDINIQVPTTDVNSISQAVNMSFKEQLRQVLYNFDDGVQG